MAERERFREHAKFDLRFWRNSRPTMLGTSAARVLQRATLGRGHEFELVATFRTAGAPHRKRHRRSVQLDMGHSVDALIELAFVFEASHHATARC
jgi:hypothetical protein